ncbi:hypothetical protein ACFYPN_05075 [Streptomyces sp. NPDC005576]|uniref:hypothetical protein n=1 Tax=Streptomyces sp. NPDC005576 TaxID=3364726 RepID=UPI0036B2CE73
MDLDALRCGNFSGLDARLGGSDRMDDAFPAAYQGRARFGEQGAISFLSVLGQDTRSTRASTAPKPTPPRSPG